MKKKIAVIGSGISGLGASLILQQQHEVHLFESDSRLGGHAHTSEIQVGYDKVVVDTGFLVYNELTYPHLIALFKYLDVVTVKSDMSLAINIPGENLEWAGDNLNTVFAQRKNLLNPRFYKLLANILRFHKEAEANRDLARIHRWTIAQLLYEQKYAAELTEWYILPMVAAIWSTPETEMLSFPAETFLTFFLNHKLLQVENRPQWWTVKNGSINYVNKAAALLKHIHLSEGVETVKKITDKWILSTYKGEFEFDDVVFAVQPPIIRRMLRTKDEQITAILDAFKSVPNEAYLHRDESFMPRSKKCWASWCVQANMKSSHSAKVTLTYYLNRLQPLGTKQNLFLTLNPDREPRSLINKFKYDHPHFNQAAIDAQTELPQIQGRDGLYFAGAWTRYGFHEDGLLSAVNIGNSFQVTPPWIKTK